MGLHVRYNSWYISLPSSAQQQQQREMTKFYGLWGTWTTTNNLLNFYFKFIVVFLTQFCDSFDSDKQSRRLQSIARFVDKIYIHFLIDVNLGVAALVIFNSLLNSSSRRLHFQGAILAFRRPSVIFLSQERLAFLPTESRNVLYSVFIPSDL